MNSIVFNEDCIEGMKRYPDKYFDLAVVDPPYGIGASEMTMGSGKKKKYQKGKKWDNETPSKEYFLELIRVSKNQIIWGGNYFELPLTKSWIFWDKGIYGDCDFADGELAWTSLNKVLRIAKIRYKGFLGADTDRIHPTQKPVKLYDWIFHNYTNKSITCGHKHTPEYNHLCSICKHPFKVLDTHLGSGSSRIAAYKHGLDFTGFELDKDYFEASEKRFNNFKSQLTLF
jgi:site-specific DNA-methyltransferase (adenine-specific)